MLAILAQANDDSYNKGTWILGGGAFMFAAAVVQLFVRRSKFHHRNPSGPGYVERSFTSSIATRTVWFLGSLLSLALFLIGFVVVVATLADN